MNETVAFNSYKQLLAVSRTQFQTSSKREVSGHLLTLIRAKLGIRGCRGRSRTRKSQWFRCHWAVATVDGRLRPAITVIRLENLRSLLPMAIYNIRQYMSYQIPRCWVRLDMPVQEAFWVKASLCKRKDCSRSRNRPNLGVRADCHFCQNHPELISLLEMLRNYFPFYPATCRIFWAPRRSSRAPITAPRQGFQTLKSTTTFSRRSRRRVMSTVYHTPLKWQNVLPNGNLPLTITFVTASLT
jgi:hypothetical protein